MIELPCWTRSSSLIPFCLRMVLQIHSVSEGLFKFFSTQVIFDLQWSHLKSQEGAQRMCWRCAKDDIFQQMAWCCTCRTGFSYGSFYLKTCGVLLLGDFFYVAYFKSRKKLKPWNYPDILVISSCIENLLWDWQVCHGYKPGTAACAEFFSHQFKSFCCLSARICIGVQKKKSNYTLMFSLWTYELCLPVLLAFILYLMCIS